jgi:alkylation response protein AidB-like acyl-CoA dehydrogenase
MDYLETIARDSAEFARSLAGDPDWRSYAGSGVLGLTMPICFGGQARDFQSLVAAFEGLAYGGADMGLLFAMAAQLWSVQYPILRFGTEQQKTTFLPQLIAGEIRAAHAASEPEAGSDIFSLKTTAVSCAGGYKLDGLKRYSTNAPTADLALVFALTEPSRKIWGTSAFLVDLNSDGIFRSPNIPKMGLQSAEFGEIRFQDCFVPKESLLGSPGSGAAIFNYALDFERSFILAPALGSMRRQLERAVAEANNRMQHGRTIGGFQSVSNRIADMRVRLELGRLAIYWVAASKDSGRSTRGQSAIVKLAVSEMFLAFALDCIRIFGASGYLLNDPAEQSIRDAVGSVIYSGTSDVLRNLIASSAGVIDA